MGGNGTREYRGNHRSLGDEQVVWYFCRANRLLRCARRRRREILLFARPGGDALFRVRATSARQAFELTRVSELRERVCRGSSLRGGGNLLHDGCHQVLVAIRDSCAVAAET